MTHIQSLLPTVIALAEQAGQMLTAEFTRPDGPRGQGSHAPVDTEIETFLRDRLLQLLPAQWRGEETGAATGPGGPFCWLVDPHDGTSAFLEGWRGTSVSIALLQHGRPVLGVVHAPLSPDRGADTLAWAEGLDHLLRNDASIRPSLSEATLSSKSLVFVSQAADEWPLENGRLVHPARFIAMPSIAYRLARAAAGDGVAAVSLHHISGWDYAAGHALLRGAGGVLLDGQGREVTYATDGRSEAARCFGGAPAAARALAERDWSGLRRTPRQPRRTSLGWPRQTNPVALDRALGCLFGLVAGDSLGSLVEFKSAAEIARRYPNGLRDLADGGTWSTFAGQPTDDSELAIALARSMATAGSWSPEATATAYAEWYSSRPFDIGTTTGQALRAAAAAAAIVQTSRAVAARNAASRTSQANGALMRCAPLGLWARNAAEGATAAREDAALTHPHPICKAASAAFVAAIATAVAGGDGAAMLAAAQAAIPDLPAEAIRDALARAQRGEAPEDFERQQGWVLIAFQNAFRHLALNTPLEQAVIETVAQGGDTDTNAAICGALLGAAQGMGAIPVRWSLAIQACRPLEELGALQPRPMRYWPDDLPLLAEALVRRG